MCASEEWKEGGGRVASCSKSEEEAAKVRGFIVFVGAEGVDTVTVANHKACQHARWMGRMGRYVKVEVQ